MALMKPSKPLFGRLGSAKVTSSPGSMKLMVPGPSSYSFPSSLRFDAVSPGTPEPVSLNGLSVGSLVFTNAEKLAWITAASSSALV